MSIEKIMDELIAEAESEPEWKAVSALRTAKKELLKEQEAVKPKIDAFGHPYCPKCKILVYETWEYCPHCGQAVKG